MYQESFIQYNDQTLFQLSRVSTCQTLIVFFHGIGDSHLNFTCFFEANCLKKYDLFIADLLGHGRSSVLHNGTLQDQCDALAAQLLPFMQQYKHVVFVPHSMGGVHATWLAANACSKYVNGIYAIETSMTQYGSFIAQTVTEVTNQGQVFSTWFKDFCDNIYKRGALLDPIYQRYYAGLQFVRESTFLDNALELYQLATSLKKGLFTNQIGDVFVRLSLPKVYCLGRAGKQLSSIPFLLENNVAIEYFDTDYHWVAQACFDDFCHRLDQFIQTSVF